MSAREELYVALMRGGPHSPDRSEKASALLDAYAHELAEKQREADCPENLGHGLHACRCPDLIDPEVSS